jgi:hypothetical protein
MNSEKNISDCNFIENKTGKQADIHQEIPETENPPVLTTNELSFDKNSEVILSVHSLRFDEESVR